MRLFSLLIIALLIVISLTITNQSRSEEDKENTLTNHSPIFINGNSNFTSANGVKGGDGSKNNPYIIENWIISGDKKNGIEIRNTTAYFIIRNVYIKEIDWIIGEPFNSGIYFYNVSNGKIENSTLSKNFIGIYFQNSTHNKIIESNISDNNQIINTLLTDFTHASNNYISLYSSRNITIENSTIPKQLQSIRHLIDIFLQTQI